MKRPAPYPVLFRVALLAAITAGALQSFAAAQGVGLVAMASDAPPAPEVNLGWLAQLTPYAREQEEAVKASYRARLNAINDLGRSRVIILLGLSAATSMLFLGALFLRWSSAAPAATFARMLGRSAIVSALLRTIDGAQDLVIARRSAEAMERALRAANVPDEYVSAGHATTLLSAVSVGWTFAVVGVFVLLGTYFRSAAVRSLLEARGEEADP